LCYNDIFFIGFPEGLYDEAEQDSGNVKDKASKVAFLDKIITCLNTLMVLGC